MSRSAISHAVAGYDPISLEGLDSAARLMNRVDTKFAVREADLAGLLGSVASDYRALEVAGVRLAPYSTLYFDTPSRRCYCDHHNGRSQRWKYRMRSYDSTGVAFFEVKQKNNKGRTVKSRVPIPEIHTSIHGEAAAMVRDSGGMCQHLVPQMWTGFSRITLVGREITERLTIDIDLEFSDPQQRRESLRGIAVVEVKQERNNRFSPVRCRLREEGISPLRVSKYCVGSALLDTRLKRNRFKATLRALDSLST